MKLFSNDYLEKALYARVLNMTAYNAIRKRHVVTSPDGRIYIDEVLRRPDEWWILQPFVGEATVARIARMRSVVRNKTDVNDD
jgi:hypothetical protein